MNSSKFKGVFLLICLIISIFSIGILFYQGKELILFESVSLIVLAVVSIVLGCFIAFRTNDDIA